MINSNRATVTYSMICPLIEFKDTLNNNDIKIANVKWTSYQLIDISCYRFRAVQLICYQLHWHGLAAITFDASWEAGIDQWKTSQVKHRRSFNTEHLHKPSNSTWFYVDDVKWSTSTFALCHWVEDIRHCTLDPLHIATFILHFIPIIKSKWLTT